MEARDLNVTADGSDPSGATAMDKVVEIMNERLNAFGVAETVVQKKGDRAIEIKIPDRTTKQNPGMIENLQKPAKLEFRIVNVDSSVRQPTEENEDWTDDEGILYRSMLRSDAEPNESPIWVQQLSSADGDIVKEAFPRQDQMGGWKSDWISLKKVERNSQASREISLKCPIRLPDPPEGLQSFWTTSWKAPYRQAANRRGKCGNQRKL